MGLLPVRWPSEAVEAATITPIDGLGGPSYDISGHALATCRLFEFLA